MSVEGAELAAVRQAVRGIMRRYDADYWRRLDEQKQFPSEFFDAMAEAGYFGTLIPEAYGGSDAGPEVASVIVEEINRQGGDAAAINAQMAISGVIVRSGSEAQRARLEQIAKGKLKCLAVAATESDSGADMSQLESSAKRQGDGWVLEAKKMFISMAEHTELLLLLVNSEVGPTLFLIDVAEAKHHIEVRPMPMVVNRMTTSLFVDGLWVPDSARVGAPGEGLACLMRGFALRRILAAAESIGNARFLLDKSLEQAKSRHTFNRPIGQNQGVQYPLAQAYAKIEAADLMRWDALRELRSGSDAGGRSALAKILASEAAWEMARAALTAFGGWALASEMHIERKLRECTVFVFNNMLLSYVSHRVLELPKAF
ncbi:MAG TPA: acyl-CoA dehydrogenase family protein [Polyangiaceae bacterium]